MMKLTNHYIKFNKFYGFRFRIFISSNLAFSYDICSLIVWTSVVDVLPLIMIIIPSTIYKKWFQTSFFLCSLTSYNLSGMV